jgi:hypothetical protein
LTIHYCYGRGKTDAHPRLRQAPDFGGFIDQILALPRATSKETRAYICAPLRANGSARLHRCKADMLPRWWLAADLDGGSRDEVEIVLMRLSDFKAVAWQTARSTVECPRWRIVVFLDREVDRAEGIRLGAAFVSVIGAELESLKWDASTHCGEQEAYLPMMGAAVKRYDGDPIDVDSVLALAPAEPPRERPATPDPYRALIIERGLFLKELGPGKDAITCPFAAEHSEQTSDSSTAYLHPLHGGYRWGRINCFHKHCKDKDRQQDDFIRALGADPQDVWRGQAREEVPIGEAPAYSGSRAEGPGNEDAHQGGHFQSGTRGYLRQ